MATREEDRRGDLREKVGHRLEETWNFLPGPLLMLLSAHSSALESVGV